VSLEMGFNFSRFSVFFVLMDLSCWSCMHFSLIHLDFVSLGMDFSLSGSGAFIVLVDLNFWSCMHYLM
jgi:hypothetical protein